MEKIIDFYLLSQENYPKLIGLAKTLLIPFFAVLILQLGVVPVEYNPLVLISVFIIIFLQVRKYIIKKGIWTYEDIGLGKKAITKGLGYYLILIVIGVGLFLLAKYITPVRNNISLPKLFFSSFICAGIQQFLFSGYLVKKMTEIFPEWKVTCVLVIIFFIYSHIFFVNPQKVLPIASLFGLVIFPIYKFHPNLILAGITHWIYNALSIYIFVFAPIWG